jgi:hypothetical protein
MAAARSLVRQMAKRASFTTTIYKRQKKKCMLVSES